jgi:hypothetical protein
LIAVKGVPNGVALPGEALNLFASDAKTIWLGNDDDPIPRAVVKGDLYTACIGGKHVADAAHEITDTPPVIRNPPPIQQPGQSVQDLPAAFQSAPAGWGDDDNIPF